MLKVGVWAASSPVKAQTLRKGLQKLRSLGILFKIPLPTKRFATKKQSPSHFYLAGPDSAKISAFLELWKDKTVHHIFCVRGGYGSLRLLKTLDARLKGSQKPTVTKMLWGFSDTTILHFYLFKKYRLPWVHSPMISGDSFSDPNLIEQKAWDLVFSAKAKSAEYKVVKLTKKTIKKPQKILLLGGNLSSLISMLGSPWEPQSKSPFVLFIEEIFEDHRRLDRLLTQLANSKFFEACSGVVCGHFTQCPGHLDILKEWALRTDIPVFTGFPAGHEKPNVPFQMGVKISIRPTSNGILMEVPLPKFVP